MITKKEDSEVVKIINEALKQSRLLYSDHALKRMEERSINVFEVETVIKYGKREAGLDEFEKKGNYWRYVVRDQNIDGRDIAVSFDIEDAPEAIIVTVMHIDPQTARKL